jgi:multicomponent Na+:H+ antiporter subunit G
MSLSEYISVLLIGIGVMFFVAGILGVLRFPDIYSRLHALTKADNVGLGFIVLGLAVGIGEISAMFKLLFIWVLVIISSATSCYLIARAALRMGIVPWRKL